MAEHLRAYNSLWQVRSDSWCRLAEAADRLTRPTTTGELKDKWASAFRGHSRTEPTPEGDVRRGF